MNKPKSSSLGRSHKTKVLADSPSSSLVSESIGNISFVQGNAMIQRQQQVSSVFEDFESILWGRRIVPLEQLDEDKPFLPDHREILMGTMSHEDIFKDDDEEGEQNLLVKTDDGSSMGPNERIFPSSLGRLNKDNWEAFFERVAPTSQGTKGDTKPAAVYKQADDALMKEKHELSYNDKTTTQDNTTSLQPYSLLRNNFFPSNNSIHPQQGDVHIHEQASMAQGFQSLARADVMMPANSSHHHQAASAMATVAGFHMQQQQGSQAAAIADPIGSLPKVQRKKSSSAARPLPLDFQPQPYSVIVGKGRESKNVIGNNRLRVLASIYLPKYAGADDDRDIKSEIVSTLIATIKNACPVGAFIKLGKDGRWYECSAGATREKVGYTLRELLGDKYKSSSKAKAAMRSLEKSRKIQEQQQQDNSR